MVDRCPGRRGPPHPTCEKFGQQAAGWGSVATCMWVPVPSVSCRIPAGVWGSSNPVDLSLGSLDEGLEGLCCPR